MAAGTALTASIDRLIELFNARSLDLPDRLISRHTQFLLNGVAFEEMLGRSPQDPLVLMLARGPAGYRFTVKALQHAVPDATAARGELVETTEGDAHLVRGQCWLSGHTRGDGAPIEMLVDIELRMRAAGVERASAAVDPALITRVQRARRETADSG